MLLVWIVTAPNLVCLPTVTPFAVLASMLITGLIGARLRIEITEVKGRHRTQILASLCRLGVITCFVLLLLAGNTFMTRACLSWYVVGSLLLIAIEICTRFRLKWRGRTFTSKLFGLEFPSNWRKVQPGLSIAVAAQIGVLIFILSAGAQTSLNLLTVKWTGLSIAVLGVAWLVSRALAVERKRRQIRAILIGLVGVTGVASLVRDGIAYRMGPSDVSLNAFALAGVLGCITALFIATELLRPGASTG